MSQFTGLLQKLTNSHLRIQNTLMGGRGAARRVDVVVRESVGYNIESHGLEGMVTERDRANFDKPYKVEEEEARALSTMIWLGKEKSLADTLTSTTLITQNTTLAGQSQFQDYANSDPLIEFRDAQQAIEDGCGLPPNVAIMNRKVRRTLRYHPLLIEFLRGKVMPGARLTDEELAKALDVETLHIAGTMFNPTAEGQSDSLSNVWGNHVVFGVLPKRAAVGQISGGYYIRKKGKQPRRVTKWNTNNPPDAKMILVEDHYDFLLSKIEAFFLIEDAVA